MLKRLEPEANPGSGPDRLKNTVPRSNGSGCTTLGRYRLLSKSVIKHFFSCPEPEFVNLLRSLDIDSQPGGPVQQPYLSYRPAMHIGWRNRILGIDSWSPETFKNTGSEADNRSVVDS